MPGLPRYTWLTPVTTFDHACFTGCRCRGAARARPHTPPHTPPPAAPTLSACRTPDTGRFPTPPYRRCGFLPLPLNAPRCSGSTCSSTYTYCAFAGLPAGHFHGLPCRTFMRGKRCGPACATLQGDYRLFPATLRTATPLRGVRRATLHYPLLRWT